MYLEKRVSKEGLPNGRLQGAVTSTKSWVIGNGQGSVAYLPWELSCFPFCCREKQWPSLRFVFGDNCLGLVWEQTSSFFWYSPQERVFQRNFCWNMYDFPFAIAVPAVKVPCYSLANTQRTVRDAFCTSLSSAAFGHCAEWVKLYFRGARVHVMVTSVWQGLVMKPLLWSFSSPTCCFAVTPTELVRYVDKLALHVEHRSLMESYSVCKASLFLGFPVGFEEFFKRNHLLVDFNLGFLFKRQDLKMTLQ